MTKIIKKSIRYIINAVSVLIVLASLLLLMSVLFTGRGNIPNVMGYSMLRVLTESMKPEIQVDSLIVVEHAEVEEIQPGDVISFYSKDPELDGMVNTHRVTRIEQEDGTYTIYTKGDANETEDEYSTDSEHLIGKVIWKNQFIGKVVRLVSNPLIFVPIIIAPLVLILVYHLWQVIHTTKEISKEQEDAYQEALIKIIKQKKRKREEAEGNNMNQEDDVVPGEDNIQ